MPRFEGEIIELTAVDPNGALACDTTIATPEARAGLAEALERSLIPPPRSIEDGVEVSFKPDSWEAVQRYVELESRCCSFLTLAARHDAQGVVLTVTGRPEAQDWIRNIFVKSD